jgi:hypothetical protein
LYALVPASFATAAFFLARLYPIDEKTHSAIRAGVTAHSRGENAIDPLTGRVVPPPSARGVDADTSWFLDTFSPGELDHVVTHGAAGLRARVAWKAGACLALFAGALALCFGTIGNLSGQPGLTPVFAVVGGGFALTGACFHALRLGPAAQLVSRAIDPALIRTHLEMARRGSSGRVTPAEALRRAS